ncbi:MAG: DUF3332 family protein [Planctomycetota bacterium]
MKSQVLRLVVVFALLVALTGCIGSFAASKKLLTWNNDIHDSKWVQEAVFVPALAGYALFGVSDVLVFNSIEFWTGNNPMNGM